MKIETYSPSMARVLGKWGRRHGRICLGNGRITDLPHDWQPMIDPPLMAPLDDWLVDTNLSSQAMRRMLPAAVEAAGLRWGCDVKVYWHSTTQRATAVANSRVRR